MKQFIKCTECGAVELASVDHSTIPFSTWIHNCSNCKHIIMEQEWEPLPAISIKNPFAWWIVNNFKDIENRNTLKNFRGIILIHASMQFDKHWMEKVNTESKEFYEAFKAMPMHLTAKDISGKGYDYGGIIGYATFTNCVQKSDSPWFIGPNGFVIKNPHQLPFTPCKGKVGIFKPENI